jgi:peptidoglycan/LPS O-acetylase OafA/YrhL
MNAPSFPLAVPEMDSVQTPAQRKSMLPALTGMRALAALNIVFFHFSDPAKFGPFAPIVRNGYVSVSFFLLLSGFVLAYNYRERAEQGKMEARRFWVARFSRIYPVYVFSLIVSLGMLMDEYHAQTRGHFYLGVVLTPLLLQGWVPLLTTFWNTPAWTLSTDVLFYALFPMLIVWKNPIIHPKTARRALVSLLIFWLLGLVLPTAYTLLHPDGMEPIGRYSNGTWLRALKFGPVQHVPSFLFGMALAALNNHLDAKDRRRLIIGLLGFAATYTVLYFGDQMPYVYMHDGLLMPVYGAIVLGLAGENFLTTVFSFFPLLAVGEASYCLYILHFNLWNLIHNSKILEKTGLSMFDPWLSYLLLVIAALVTVRLIERPGQAWVKKAFGM